MGGFLGMAFDSFQLWEWQVFDGVLLILLIAGLVSVGYLRRLAGQRTREMQSILDEMQDVVYRSDADGLLTMVTPVIYRMGGYHPEEVLGKPVSNFYEDPKQRDELLEILERDGRVHDFRIRLRTKSGGVVWAAVSSHLLRNDKGKVIGVEGTFRDVADLVEAEKKILAARERAERANEAKTRFLAAASHDLRQPLQAMRLYLDVLDGQLHEPEARKLIGRIHASHDDVSGLLGRLLHISQMDIGEVHPDHQVFDLSRLLREIHTQHQALAEKSGLEWRLHLPSDVLCVRSDAVYVRELLGNLLSNAFHYTRHGGVLLAARLRGGNVRVEVWDTGCGIAEGEQERIFDELVQLDNPERDRSKGVGLGLSIASRLAGMLDTRIHLSSRTGRGSVFAFELPLCMEKASAESVADSAPMQADFGGGCLFVIDDDPQVREGLAMLLKQWRCDVSCFADGEEALAALQRAERIPEVIICDYRLPNQSNGVDVIRALRREAGAEIPALLLSGETDEATMQAASNADVPLLHKPVSARRLGMFLGRCLLEGE